MTGKREGAVYSNLTEGGEGSGGRGRIHSFKELLKDKPYNHITYVSKSLRTLLKYLKRNLIS